MSQDFDKVKTYLPNEKWNNFPWDLSTAQIHLAFLYASPLIRST